MRDVAIVVALSTAVLAVLCFGVSGDDDDALFKFTFLSGLMAVFVVFLLWEKRVTSRRYQECWRRVCHVLEEDHSHEGLQLIGSWKGRPFRAFANLYYGGEYVGTVKEYRLSMPAEQPGPGWRAERATATRGARGPETWTISARDPSVADRLIEAGLVAAIQDAERNAVHIRPGVRLSFHPRVAEVAYEDQSGEAPCAADLVVHLDLVRRAVDVHAAAMASMTGPSEGKRS